MIDWVKQNRSLVWWWAALLAGTAIFFAVTRGTQLGQLGMGLFTATVVLFVLVSVFELAWRAIERSEEPPPPGRTPPRGRR